MARPQRGLPLGGREKLALSGSFKVGRIAGIEIGIHYTWILAFILIAWSLAAGFFPRSFPDWGQTTYWITGIVAALLLFISVLAHELAHSLVARARGMAVRNITLFIFGGVSNIASEAERPKDELAMTIVGPLTSLALAAIFWGLRQVVGEAESPLSATLGYLALINALLAGFNLLPGFPLDGGRVLRSILWSTTGSLSRATSIAATVGQILAWLFIGFGVFQLLGGNFLGGLWIAFIGWFLNGAAETSRGEITVREHLRGVQVGDIMDLEPEIVSSQTKVEEVVREVFLHGGRRAAAVCHEDRLVGIVTLADVKELPQEEWANTPVEKIMTGEPFHSVGIHDDLSSALRLLGKNDLNQIPVLQDGRLKGLLSRADIIRYLQLSQELDLSREK